MASLTVKVATPLVLVAPLGPLIVEWPGPWASDTVLPLIGPPPESAMVTETVEVEEPSAATVAGDEETLEADDEAAPAAKVTCGNDVRATLSVVSVTK